VFVFYDFFVSQGECRLRQIGCSGVFVFSVVSDVVFMVFYHEEHRDHEESK